MRFRLNETVAARRRAWFFLIQTDGITPAAGEGGGQPQISKNGAAFVNTDATLVHIGDGTYYVELTQAELDTPGHIFIVYENSGVLNFSLPVAVVEDILSTQVPGSYASGSAGSALGKLNSTTPSIAIASPVSADGSLTIVQGDDYLAADNRALDFTDTSLTWPDLTGADVRFLATRTDKFAKDCEVVTPTGSSKKVRLELTSAETSKLFVGASAYSFDLQATLSNGSIVTLLRGAITVLKDE